MTGYDKRECFSRATGLLSKKDDDALTYVALELRLCLEAIIYEKLGAYSKYVPSVVFEKWQPTHALKMLLQFEPGADENLRMRIAPEDPSGQPAGPWVDLGEHRTLQLTWLVKNYNKLGSYLHAPRGPSPKIDSKKMREDLERIAAEIKEVLESPIVGVTLAERVQFRCVVCGQDGLANAEGVRLSKRVHCVNPDCGAVYNAEEGEKGWKLHLEVSAFDCLSCGSPVQTENRFLDIGRRFVCSKCNTEHVFVGRQWGYVKAHDIKGGTNQGGA